MYCQMKKKSPSPCLAPPIIVHGSAHAAGNHNQGSVSCLRFLLHLSARLFRSLSQKKCTFFFFPTNISLPDQWAESLHKEIQQVLELVQDKCWEHMMWERRKGTPLGLCVTLLYPFLWIIFWNQSLMQRKFSDKKIITNTHGYHNVFYHPRERRGNRTQNFLSKQLELYNYS